MEDERRWVSRVGRRLPQVQRIAVLRANALGDFVMTLPALDALRAAYPAAQIVLLGTPTHAELLEGRPGPVDRVEVVPPSRGVREVPGVEPDPAQLADFRERMRAERFDLALQLHGGGRWSNPFLLALGAGTTAGLRAVDAEPLDLWVPYVYYHHEILRLLEVVALVGAEPTAFPAPALAVTPADLAPADSALADLSGPVVVIHPGANDSRRCWPTESFAAVGDALARAGASVVITGSRAERSLGERVAAQMAEPATVRCGELGLSGLVGLLERSVLVLSNDTGPRHLAEAVGTATVSIYWCGNLINAGPLARTRHRAHLSWQLACPVCGSGGMADLYPARTGGTECRHAQSYVGDVPVAEVLPDALDLYASEIERLEVGAERLA